MVRAVALSFGSANASCVRNKEAATHVNDLHSQLSSTFPEVPFRLAERLLPSPILKTYPLTSLKCGPSNGAAFLDLNFLCGTDAFDCAGSADPLSTSPVISLEKPPYEVSQKRKEQQHKYAAHPYQEIQRHLGRINLFLVHVLTLAGQPFKTQPRTRDYRQGTGTRNLRETSCPSWFQLFV